MPSKFEEFWTHQTYAVVGNSAAGKFPGITYGALKAQGKTVYPVDKGTAEVAGDKTFASFASLPSKADGVVLEVPRAETAGWVAAAAEAGIPRVWIHMQRDTPEALALAKEKGLEVCHGTCAVMYLRGGFSPHGVHRVLRKLSGNY
jgi:predicted CoA-binding protein